MNLSRPKEHVVQTVYDWLTIAMFAGLITLFLNRSNEKEPRDTLVEYVPAAIGCALVNFAGNNGQQVLAVLGIVAILAYVWFVLKPLER